MLDICDMTGDGTKMHGKRSYLSRILFRYPRTRGVAPLVGELLDGCGYMTIMLFVFSGRLPCDFSDPPRITPSSLEEEFRRPKMSYLPSGFFPKGFFILRFPCLIPLCSVVIPVSIRIAVRFRIAPFDGIRISFLSLSFFLHETYSRTDCFFFSVVSAHPVVCIQ
jgi:hypothetical protein